MEPKRLKSKYLPEQIAITTLWLKGSTLFVAHCSFFFYLPAEDIF